MGATDSIDIYVVGLNEKKDRIMLKLRTWTKKRVPEVQEHLLPTI